MVIAFNGSLETDDEPGEKHNGMRESVMLSVVIPALNEEAGIADIVRRIQWTEPALKDAGVENVEIIVVDDGSHDRTAEIVAGLAPVRLVRHSANRGYGAAIKTGFCHARGELLAFLDADGTYPPEQLPVLCQVALSGKADVVVGSRRSGAATQMPLVRQVGNFIWSNMVSVIGNQRVADPASGMRVLRRSALPQLYPLPDGLNFTPVMSTRATYENLRVVEVPIAYRERVGQSKLSVLRDGSRFLTTILWTALEYNPVRVLGGIGLAALGVATLIGLALLAIRLQGVDHLGHLGVFSLFSAMVLAAAGTSVFCLGATFNYLVSLHHKGAARKGLFGRPIFDPSLDHHFGWIGIVEVTGGVLLSGVVLAFGASGWDLSRVWFWLLASALFVLTGLQLIISWILMRVLEALSTRESRVFDDLARGHRRGVDSAGPAVAEASE